MTKAELAKRIISELLGEIEEEDIGISLLTTYSEGDGELEFFNEPDRQKVVHTLQKLAEDSHRHKAMIYRIVSLLEKDCHEN